MGIKNKELTYRFITYRSKGKIKRKEGGKGEKGREEGREGRKEGLKRYSY